MEPRGGQQAVRVHVRARAGTGTRRSPRGLAAQRKRSAHDQRNAARMGSAARSAARPAVEARLSLLEKKTDDLSVLKQIVTQQSENIKSLSETVKSDHDLLVSLIAQLKIK